jgi:hypothetical protein
MKTPCGCCGGGEAGLRVMRKTDFYSLGGFIEGGECFAGSIKVSSQPFGLVILVAEAYRPTSRATITAR